MTGVRPGVPASSRIRRLRNIAVTLFVVMVSGVWAAAPAAAHNSLRSSNPAADATLARTPAEIVLTFDEPAIAMGTRVLVNGPSGAVPSGVPRLVDNMVIQTLQPGAPAGRYVVDWRVTSADGHPLSGTLSFTSAAAGSSTSSTGTGEPSTPGPSTAPSTSSPWVALVAAVVAVAVLAGIVAVVSARPRASRRARLPRYDRSASAADPASGCDGSSTPTPSDSPSRAEARRTPDE